MTHPTPIDITTIPELARITEEVEATKTPRELKRENKTVAVIMPAPKATAKKKRAKTKADYEAFKAAATAIEHNLTLVTRNTKDYQRIPSLKLYKAS